MTDTFPRIENTPGIAWRKRADGWEARWRARQDLVAGKDGFRPRNVRLWVSKKDELTPNDISAAWISDQCVMLQTEMLVWARGGIPVLLDFDGTVKGLAECFQRDPDSLYHKKRYVTRQHYDVLCKRIIKDIGHHGIGEISARDLLRWHETFLAKNHIPMGHACIGMLRTLTTFGATILADKRCRELKVLLHDMRFQDGKPRSEHLTVEQVIAVRAEARKQGLPSIALAQAFQFELTLRQKDVIGEWVPVSEAGPLSAVTYGNEKWIRGVDWREVDENWVLRHVTSKRQKEIVVNLLNAQMVVEELGNPDRAAWPASGPIVVSEQNGRPWTAARFRKFWRKFATDCGVPKTVRNMDSRSGAITEALAAGASLDDTRKGATHSDIGMTQKYSRSEEEATARVMQARTANRNKTGS